MKCWIMNMSDGVIFHCLHLPVDILEESLSDITKLILRFWKKAAAAAGRYIWSDYIHEKDYWLKKK